MMFLLEATGWVKSPASDSPASFHFLQPVSLSWAEGADKTNLQAMDELNKNKNMSDN